MLRNTESVRFLGEHNYVFTMDIKSLYTTIPNRDGLLALTHFLVLQPPTRSCSPRRVSSFLIGHFTVTDKSEAGVDLVLIQTFVLYYVNQVIFMLTSVFQGQFP